MFTTWCIPIPRRVPIKHYYLSESPCETGFLLAIPCPWCHDRLPPQNFGKIGGFNPKLVLPKIPNSFVRDIAKIILFHHSRTSLCLLLKSFRKIGTLKLLQNMPFSSQIYYQSKGQSRKRIPHGGEYLEKVTKHRNTLKSFNLSLSKRFSQESWQTSSCLLSLEESDH